MLRQSLKENQHQGARNKRSKAITTVSNNTLSYMHQLAKLTRVIIDSMSVLQNSSIY